MSKIFEISEKCIMNPEQQDQIRCRICYDIAKPLLSICGCIGSICYVHQDCALDWISKKIQNSESVQVPHCEVCSQKFAANLTIGKKHMCFKTLWSKVSSIAFWEKVWTIFHIICLVIAVFYLLNFLGSILTLKLFEQMDIESALSNIFTNFIAQIYIVKYFCDYIKDKTQLVHESMIQIIEVTLCPKKILKD